MSEHLIVNQLTSRLKIGSRIFSVVDRLSFKLEKGKVLAIVGESGSGKTMTALSIMRILQIPPFLPPQGEVIFDGINILKLSERQMRKIRGKKIAMIFQDPMTTLNPVFTIGHQLLEVAATHLKLFGDEAKRLACKALDDVGLYSSNQIMQSYPHQISGGMKQRAMIAMALLCNPEILIADEPTTALDVTIQAQILELLKKLQKERGMSIILITHDMGVVAEIADQVIVMYATQKIEQGSSLAIFDHRAHPYTQGLFRSQAAQPLKKGKLHTISGNVPPITELPDGCLFNPRCPYVMDICRSGEVPDFPLAEPGHVAKCWLNDPNLHKK